MSLLFFLLTLYFYTSGVRHQGAGVAGKKLPFRVYYFFALLSYALALLSKEMAITLPLILILHDVCFSPLKAERVKDWLIYLPFFLISGIYLIIRTLVLGQVAQTEYMGGSFGPTMYTMAKGIILYLKLLILPINLCGDYLAFPISNTIDMEVVYSFTILAAIIIAGIVSYRYNRFITFAIFWFFITLLPVSNIVPIKILIAERFLYIPSFGFVLLLGVLAKGIIESCLSNTFKGGLAGILLISIVLYTYGTVERNKVWRDEFSFWGDVLKKCPSSRAYTSYGFAYMEEKGDIDKAMGYYERALSLDPWSSYALNNLAVAYLKKGLIDEAIRYYKEAIIVEPNNPNMHVNLGNAYKKKHLIDEAIAEYKRALQIKPDLYEARSGLAEIYMELGQADEVRRILGE